MMDEHVSAVAEYSTTTCDSVILYKHRLEIKGHLTTTAKGLSILVCRIHPGKQGLFDDQWSEHRVRASMSKCGNRNYEI